MKHLRRFRIPVLPLFFFFLFLPGTPFRPGLLEGKEPSETRMTLEVKGEDRDVGMKRMEILEKALSPEILERKSALVRMREEDYNRKIAELLRRLTTPIGKNTVITHIDVDLLASDFEHSVRSVQNVSVTVVMDKDGFAKWAAGKGTDEAAEHALRSILHRSFRIPEDRITLIVAPN